MAKRKAKKIIRGLRTLDAREMDRRHAAGYQKTPEGAAWSKASVKLLSWVLPKEKW